MSNFFNGVDDAEVAALNTSSNDLGIIVKELLANTDRVGVVRKILNDEDLEPLDRDIELTSYAREEMPALQSYSRQAVRDKISRLLNGNSRTIAKKLGHSDYLKYSRGKVQQAKLLESK